MKQIKSHGYWLWEWTTKCGVVTSVENDYTPLKLKVKGKCFLPFILFDHDQIRPLKRIIYKYILLKVFFINNI